MKKQEKEIWLPVAGVDKRFLDLYLVSNLGNVYSKRSDKKLLFYIDKKGYLRIYLFYKGYKKRYLVHRLIALAFLLNPLNKPQVNHKNLIKTDNRVDNLEWATLQENIAHAKNNNAFMAISGENNYYSRLTDKDVLKIRKLYSLGVKQAELSRLFNYKNIHHIVTRKAWKHI